MWLRTSCELIEQPDGRRMYQTPVGVLPSVTTILAATDTDEDRAGLEAWRERVGAEEADRIRDAACHRGNLLHLAIEDWIDDRIKPEESDPVRPYWDSMTSILLDPGMVYPPHAVEEIVYHPELGYAGTVDFAARFRSNHCVVDWKTADKPKRAEYLDKYKMQVAAYAVATQVCPDWATVPPLESALVAIAIPGRSAQEVPLDSFDVFEWFSKFEERLRRYWEMEGE